MSKRGLGMKWVGEGGRQRLWKGWKKEERETLTKRKGKMKEW